MTEQTGPPGHASSAIPARLVAAGGGALLLIFAALAVWALQDPTPDLPPDPLPSKRPQTITTPPAPDLPKTLPAPIPQPLTNATQIIKPPRDLSKLLNQRFQFTRQDGTPAFAQLRSALASERAVTLLNVWAPYCEPCKREFPAFRQLQSEKQWADQVRFMPIQLGEGDPGPLADVMPTAPHHLIDFAPGGAVQNTLAELGLLPDHAPIPITLLLDCRHQLRWLSAQEITDIDGFDAMISELRRELDTPACARPQPAAEPQPTDHCGNHRCEPLEHAEDCLTCPADCGCKPGQLCASQTGARDKLGHVCMDELQ